MQYVEAGGKKSVVLTAINRLSSSNKAKKQVGVFL